MTVESPVQTDSHNQIPDSLVLLLPQFITDLVARMGHCRTRAEIIREIENRYCAVNKVLFEGKFTPENLHELHSAQKAYIGARAGYKSPNN